jgi:catechol 2,3-dioxygenase-like lactoylglutathione lyase family enzyme
MTVTVRVASVVVNCVDVDRQVDFWRSLLGVDEYHRVDDAFVWLQPQQPNGVKLAFQQVVDPTPGRRRLHLDCSVDDLDAAEVRIRGLGGAHLEDHEVEGYAWKVMADPEGNEFCIGVPAGQHG